MARERSRSKSRERRRRSRSRSGGRDRDRHAVRDRSRERTERRKRSRSRDKERRRHSRSRSPHEKRAFKEKKEERKERKKEPVEQVPINVETIADAGEDVAKLMGFEGFDTTKNKKVDGNYEGVVRINKMRRYRQYMNRKGGFNRPLDYVA